MFVANKRVQDVIGTVIVGLHRRTDGQTDRQTDRQTDGIAVASTALAMRSLRRAVKTYLLLTRIRGTVGAVETLGVEYKHCCRFTERHVVIGHRQYPRDTCPRYLYRQYGERHIALNFKRRYQPSWCKENLSSLLYFLQVLSTQHQCVLAT